MGNGCSAPCSCMNECCKCWTKKKSYNDNYTKENIGNPMALSSPVPSPNNDSNNVDEVTSDALTVRVLDFCLETNGREHHTEKYDAMHRDQIPGLSSTLVVRRGQTFKLIIGFNRPFDSLRDSISFIFTLVDEERPNHGNGTLIGTTLKFDYYNTGDPLEWGCAIESQHNDILEIVVKPAANAAIGEWRFDIDTQLINGAGSYTYKSPSSFYLLFNPWCRDDQVYLPGDEERDEYVLADSTLVWRGSYNRMRPSIWKLGQFERHVLECSLLLISSVGRIAPAFRGDPVKIARALSAVVNSPDDDGAILGNWSEDFSGGTAPTKWVGSVAILQQYYKKRKPVKFGQCWTFAGTLTTMARAIGIPSRIITTYACAHDTQASLTVDYFVDENGKVLEELNSDSIWNYHVWNEVWMDRPDLGPGYSGWQAVDATPQEMSDGMYRCGPAPVRAVKLGEVLRPYDCNFLYAEVNADKIFWRYTGPHQPLKLLRKDIYGIGLLITTKAVGKWEREDITSSYKFEEKTRDERDTMLKALRQTNSVFSRFYLNEEFNDVYFNFDLLDDIKIGETFFVILRVKNRSFDSPYTVTGTLNVESILYTGKNREEVKSLKFEQELQPSSSELIKLEVSFDDYYSKLMDQAAFNISCMATVNGTEYDYFAQDDFRVRKPDIKITLQGEPISHNKIDVILRLTNPLPIPLKKGLFQLEGPGIENQLLFKISEVPVGGTASATFKYTPPYAGRATFAVRFNCKELDDCDGFLAFEVAPRPEDVIIGTDGRHSNEIIIRRDVVP